MNQVPPPEPPKPPSKTPHVVGVLLAVAGTAAITVSVMGYRAHRSVRSPAIVASEAPSAAPRPAAQALPPVAPSSYAAPEPEDETGGGPASPRASERARPAWSTDRTYAPQLDEPLPLFLAASPLRGDVSRAFVICRVQSFNKMDTFAGDDVRATVTFAGTTPARTADGPEDANLAFVSAPLASITHGDTLHFDVWDRDVFDNELITRTQASYDAGPLVLADPGASIECRSLDGAALDRETKAHGAEADRDARALASHGFDGRKPDWGYPWLEIMKAQTSTSDVAALLGWADARARKRVEGLAAAEAMLDARRRQLFDELRGAAKDDGDVHGLHAHVDEIACGPRKTALGAHAATSPCVARISLRNDAIASASLAASALHAYVATPASGPVAADFLPFEKIELLSGESVELVVVPRAVEIDAAPAVVGLCFGSSCVVLRAR